MTLFLVFLVLAVLAGMVWMWRSQQQPKPRKIPSRQTQAAPARPGGLDKLEKNPLFGGVELSVAGCAAADALQGQHFAFADAPELPVPGCDSANCTCQFKGLKDNRTGHRRTHEDRRHEIRFDKEHPDRRSRKSRRRGGKWDDRSY